MNTQNYESNLVSENGSVFALSKVLGSGGMGIVYLATRRSDGKTVAIKLPLHSNSDLQSYCIEREANVLKSLKRDGIFTIVESGKTSNGLPFVAFDYAEGQSLQQLLDKRGTLLISEALSICTQVAKILSKAHKREIVHQDIKPANIIISQSGKKIKVSVIDFGIASCSRQQNTLDSIGSPLYMSPEQMCGAEVTAKSDLYQLGLVLFQCLFGRLPFEPNLSEAISYRFDDNGVPDWCTNESDSCLSTVNHLLHQLLNRSPQRRPDSMRSLADKLRSIALWVQIRNLATKASHFLTNPVVTGADEPAY